MQVTGTALYRLARELARVKHAGQVRKGSGEPYFNHVQRVADRVIGWRAKTIALLHDILEDTNLAALELRHVGFPWDLVDDVVTLTRIERIPADAIDGGSRREEYFEFIERTIRDGSNDALYVKLADLADNLRDEWIDTTGLRARYIKADLMIRAELHHRGMPLPGERAA